MNEHALSVLLPTYNCVNTVRATLESVKWAGEILVVDSFSSDGTLELCQEYGARVLQHEYLNSAKQKNWAAPQCRHDWVLQIDSDEILSPELAGEIRMAIADAPAEVDAYRMPRRNYVLGRWMRHGGIYPDYQTRLFRRDRARWRDREVHSHMEVSGRVATLHNDLIHHGMDYLTRQIRNLDRYTRYETDELKKHGKTFHWHDLLLRPMAALLYRYIWLQGFREGWRGLILSGYMAFYVFLTRAKLWEMEELGLDRSPG